MISKRIPFSSNIIRDAKEALRLQGVIPRWIKLSPAAHETLLREMNRRQDDGIGRRYSRLFEIMGLRIDIEPEIPAGGGYMGGEEIKESDELRIKFEHDK